MKKEVVSKVAIIIAICIATVALVLGFVTVNKLSKINPKSEDNSKYSLYFDKNSFKETPLGKTLTDKKNSGVSGTNITGMIALKEEGDSINYTWNIVNNGTVSAKLAEEPELLGLNDNDKQAIEYEVYINDESVSKGIEIGAGEIATAKLVIKYKKNSPTIINPGTVQVVSLTFNFTQK